MLLARNYDGFGFEYVELIYKMLLVIFSGRN